MLEMVSAATGHRSIGVKFSLAPLDNALNVKNAAGSPSAARPGVFALFDAAPPLEFRASSGRGGRFAPASIDEHERAIYKIDKVPTVSKHGRTRFVAVLEFRNAVL